MLDQESYSVLDAVPALVFTADVAGQNTYVNSRFQDYTGKTSDQMSGGQWLEVLHPDDRDGVTRSWAESIREGSPWEVECRLRRHDGQYRWHLCRAEPARNVDGGENEWFGTCFDIDQRKQADEARAWLASLVAASDDAIISKTLDGTIRSWNSAAERIFGYSSAEAVGRPITLIIPADRPDEEPSILERLRRGERVDHFETERVAKDGRRVAVSLTVSPVRDDAGLVIGASSVARDITQRRQMAEALAASRAELRLVTDHAAVMLAHCDRDSRYLFVNRTYIERFGLDPAAVIGRRIPDVIGPDAYAIIEPHVNRVLAGEVVEFEAELRYEALGPRVMHCIYVPEFGDGREVRGFVAAIADASERKQLEEQLVEADRRKDEFLAILGHELRNPLAPLSTGVELLKQAEHKPELVDDLRRVMQRQLAHLTRLVDDLVDVSRISRGLIQLQPAKLDVGQVVHDAVELAKPLIDDRRHELVVEQPDQPQHLFGDPERLTQVVANLLTNAAKYTKPGGSIRLWTEMTDAGVMLHVSDNGLGIAVEHLRIIFEMFSQLPEHRQHVTGRGLGIGLALSRQLIELHGGSIEARSAGAGHGSEFVVTLPLSAQPSEDVADLTLREDGECRGVRILVVDDNVDAADGLQMLLDVQGHDARVAYDGAAALRMLQDFPAEVVLLDIGLPEMDGYEVARRIREMPGRAKVLLIALTGWGQAEARVRSEEAGFDAHLTKPVDHGQLSSLLRLPPTA